ncbi:MAG: response regulator transcription factor [Acidobacteriota bacterium]
MGHRILIVEDEKDIATLVSFHLSRVGFQTEICHEGLAALDSLRKHPPSLVVLDLMLPDMDGIEICKRIKFQSSTQQIPILILTSKSTEMDRILGLELGADDYLPKPFSPRELVLRVQSILRRLDSRGLQQTPLKVGALTIDTESHHVYLHDKPIDLTATEFKLLHYLTERRGKVVRREDLLSSVWGYSYVGGTRTVDSHMQRLRQKLEGAADCIDTVRSVGYRLRDPDSESE